MAIVTSEKIFVDPKEEVTTILERILKSEKSRVVLVLPLNSVLLGSYITINILFREIARSPKVAVMVTEDEYGKTIAKKAGFEVVSKVSLVTSDEWDKAMQSKKELLNVLEQRKNALLKNFQGDEAYEEVPEIAPEPEITTTMTEAPDVETVEPVSTPVDEVVPADLSMAAAQMAASVEAPKFGSEPAAAELNIKDKVAKAIEAEEEAMVKRFKKPRREPKVTTIDGIEILSGGDILNVNKPQEYDKIDVLTEPVMPKSIESKNMNSDGNLNNADFSRAIPPRNVSNFTGSDFTKGSKKRLPFGGFFKFFGDRVSRNNDVRANTNGKRKKYLIIGFAVLIFLFLTGGYVLAFQASSVDITLQLKKEDVNTSASIVVDPAATDITPDPLTIPGIKLTQDNLSISRTGQADGVGKTGVKAEGLIDIWNIHETNEIVLNAGTKITSISNNLVYVLKNNVTVPAITSSGGVDQSSHVENIPVTASDVGAEYNIAGSDTNTQFQIEGYQTADMYGRRYNDFTGGASTPTVTVSQDNIDALKKLMLPDITKDGETKLKLQVPTGYRYLPETLTFVEKETVSNPLVNTESTDKTFNLSISGSVTAVAVKEDDLQKAVTLIIQKDKASGGQVTVQSVADLSIDKVEKQDTKLVLTISSKSSLQKTINIDQIKQDIAGKSTTDAKDYLNLVEQVDKYKLTFNPDIVPESIRRVPSDLSRINIKTQ